MRRRVIRGAMGRLRGTDPLQDGLLREHDLPGADPEQLAIVSYRSLRFRQIDGDWSLQRRSPADQGSV